MNDTTPSPADPPRRGRAAVIVGVLVLAALGLAGWKAWQLHGERSRAERAAESSQWQRFETRLDTLRSDSGFILIMMKALLTPLRPPM